MSHSPRARRPCRRSGPIQGRIASSHYRSFGSGGVDQTQQGSRMGAWGGGRFSPQVVAVFERGAGVKYDVHLDDQLVPAVVGLQPLDLLDGLGKPHGQVEHCGELKRGCGMDSMGGARVATSRLTDVSLVRCCGKTGEMSDVLKRGLGPVENDDEGEQQTTEGIKPPDLGVVADCAGA